MTVTVEVNVTPPYPVRIGSGVLAEADRWLTGRKVALVSDEVVAPLHAGRLTTALQQAGREVHLLTVPAGEAAKSLACFAELSSGLARLGFGRDDAVVALGGGVVSDLAGFVAASYARGVELLIAPTTVLAMADAAIGGKTGVNLPEGKNLVGAFWRPRAVLMDVSTLRTLPPALFLRGAVEVFKHGLLAEPDLAEAVLDGRLGPEASDEDLTRWLATSARVKAEIVARDELEQGLARATLNLGHTVAHALEAVAGHSLDHGEAVAWGLLYAATLSRLEAQAHGREAVDWTGAARRLIARVQPAAPPADLDWDALAPYLARDKKNREGRQVWVLADAPGRAYLARDVPCDRERAAWRAFLGEVTDLAGATDGR